MSVVTFTSVLVLATQADGREASLVESNDGGAWLADRTRGGAAHIESLTKQVTVKTSVTEPGAKISVRQSAQIVALYDQTAPAITVVDGAAATVVSTTAVPVGTQIVAYPGGLFLFDSEQSTLWAPSGPELASATDLKELVPLYLGTGDGQFFASRDGQAAVVLPSTVVWLNLEQAEPSVVSLPEGFRATTGTFSSNELVLVDGNRWVTVNENGVSERALDAIVELDMLQQSSDSWPLVGAISRSGNSLIIDLVSGTVVDLDDKGLAANSAPIFFEGCLYSLSGAEVVYRATCGHGANERSKEPSLSEESELRLVNGTVWIDALDGSGFVVTPELDLEAIADFSQAFDQNDGDESADGENVEQALDQGAEDAELTEAEQRELDQENEPPVAEDDEAATRAGRPVVVDVLANDSDPNSDVLLVDNSLQLISGEAGLMVTSAANGVQVTPLGIGIVTFRYSISDGSPGGTDSAVVTVEVKPLTQEGNSDPIPALDRATGAAGTTVSANLLDNDTDPDGDAMVLLDLDTSSVEGLELVSIHPNGDVTLDLPASVGAGTFEIPYQIEDEWQARAEGTLRLVVRLGEANSPPDARNDAGITVVDRRITIDLLANDVDPDNDLLAIGQNARLLGEQRDIGFLETTEAGEFIFEPSEPGTYLFDYSATDRQESDSALIRIEVTVAGTNRAPLAQRDDVALSQGERRLVRALDNDGDPDGDVLGISFTGDNESLEIERVPGVGFWVSMLPGAGQVELFEYRLSDGLSESGPATIVVTRSLQTFADSAPVVIDDSARVRPGRSSQLFVLRNDYDPEGGSLVITQVESTVAEVVVEKGSGAQSVVVEVGPDMVLPFALSYTVADEAGNQQAGTVQVSIVPENEPNTAPTARPDSAVTTERESVLIPVLANDSDADSDSMSLTFNPEQPAHGVAELTEDKQAIIYTAHPDFVGTDTFTYLVQDSEGGQAVGAVRVGVMPIPVINQDPEATPDEYLFESGSGTHPLDVLTNDTDPDGDAIRIIKVDSLASIAADAGSLRIDIPVVSSESTIAFTYEIGDGRGGTDSATVEVVVSPTVEPLAPVARPDEHGPVRAGEVVDVAVTANDDDPDGEVSTLVVTSSNPAAQVIGQSLRITAPEETTDYRYTITDEQGLTASSTLRVLVQPNLPPVVQSPHLGEISSDDEFEVDLRPFATDPDGDELVFSGISAQIGGTPRTIAEVSDASRVIFLPNGDYSGEGGFSFIVDDGNGNQVTGRVTFTLTGPTNLPPEAVPAAPVELEAGVSQRIDFAPFFSDPDEDELSFVVRAGPGAPVEVESEGSSSFTIGAPITAEAAETTFTVEATDPDGESVVGEVRVVVSATRAERPLVGPDSNETTQGEPVSTDVLQNDRSRLGVGELTITNVSSTDGSASVDGDGRSVTFAPDPDFFGEAIVQYTVVDDRNNAEGEAQGILSVNVIGRPAAPTGLGADALPPRSISVIWRAPDARGAAIERYDIEVNGNVEQSNGSPSKTFNGMVPGDEYVFRVRAVNVAGEGEWSVSSDVVIVDEVPGMPGKPAVQFGDTELALSWADAPNEGSPIEIYEVEIGQCQAGRRETTGTTYTWNGLENGVRCSFQVRAVNKAGPGPYSPASDLECPVGLPEAPTKPTALRGDKEATVSFNQPANPDCEPLLGFDVVRNPGGTTRVAAGTLQSTATGLDNGTSYTFEVRAQNRGGVGAFSPPSDPVTPCGPPLAPPAPTAVEGDKQVTLTLNGQADANGCEIENYQYLAVGGAAIPGVPSQTHDWASFVSPSVTITGLDNGAAYEFQVRAINDEGVGDASSPSNVVVPAGPPLITSVVVAGSDPVQWNVEASHNGRAIDGWIVGGDSSASGSDSGAGMRHGYVDMTFACLLGGANCRTASSSNPTPPSACVQQPGTVSASFAARNAIGSSATSSASATLPGCPSPPTWGTVSAGDGTYSASWNRPTGTDRLYLQVNGSYGSPRTGNSVNVSATNGQTYTLTLWACNGFGCQKSASRTATPTAPDPTIRLSQGGTGDAAGSSWYIVTLSDFPPNTSVRLHCHDSVDTYFYAENFTTNGSGALTESTLCYSADGPAHWVTGGGATSNTVNWN